LDVRPLKRTVTSAVLVFLPKAGADLEVQILRDGRIARVEQPVEIRPEQQTIANLVRSVMRVRADVGRFERREGVLSRNGASATVSIEDGDSPSCSSRRARTGRRWGSRSRALNS
jgi:hypothetical protein